MTEEQRRQFDERRRAMGGSDEEGGGARQLPGPPAGPGAYVVKMTMKGRVYTTTLAVREDPGLIPR
jgi:hypothetical protein